MYSKFAWKLKKKAHVSLFFPYFVIDNDVFEGFKGFFYQSLNNEKSSAGRHITIDVKIHRQRKTRRIFANPFVCLILAPHLSHLLFQPVKRLNIAIMDNCVRFPLLFISIIRYFAMEFDWIVWLLAMPLHSFISGIDCFAY